MEEDASELHVECPIGVRGSEVRCVPLRQKEENRDGSDPDIARTVYVVVSAPPTRRGGNPRERTENSKRNSKRNVILAMPV